MHYKQTLCNDNTLARLVQSHPGFTLSTQKNLFYYLCASIVGQQLSTRVAAVIRGRLLAHFSHRAPTPTALLATSNQALREIGLSHAKIEYIKNVAAFALANPRAFTKITKMSNEAVIAYLTPIKGVGQWTVEMLLMFGMGREDVFAVNDLGLQQAMRKYYGWEGYTNTELKKAMEAVAENWRPYRTYACMHLWAALDAEKSR